MDEAGRGPFAGPVVAAALILPDQIHLEGLNDSKKLTTNVRLTLNKEIRANAVAFGIGQAEVQEIEKINILQATFLAMKRAVLALQLQPDYILVDGRDFPVFEYNGQAVSGRAIIKGDSKSAAIAGASILAKVYRDKIMVDYAVKYPGYGFEQHKGYGTKMHRQRLLDLGPCPIHRKKFIRKTFEQKQFGGIAIPV